MTSSDFSGVLLDLEIFLIHDIYLKFFIECNGEYIYFKIVCNAKVYHTFGVLLLFSERTTSSFPWNIFFCEDVD